LKRKKLAVKPYTTGVVVELTDKEKRATNKKIKEEVLQKIHQFKAELSVYNAFGPEHWKCSFLKWQMLAIIPISCSLASPELVKAGGPKPL
jgi:hypothetical protein